MHVGIYGGAFNPPHIGHLIVAETVREQCGCDQVLWMPSYQPPHKQVFVAPEHRLAMTWLATQGNPGFAVSDLEVQRQGTSYTVDTVHQLQETDPDTTFSLIMGGDSLRSFHTWHQPDEIVACVPLVVYHRSGEETSEVDPRFLVQARFVVAPLLDVSSTDIRARYHAGRSVRYLIPDAVQAYIEVHGLYL